MLTIKQEEHIAEASFREHFHSFFEGLHRYAYSLVRDNEEARDVVQAAFAHLWKRREAIRNPEAVRSYLYTSVHNLCLNALRKKAHAVRYRQHAVNTQQTAGWQPGMEEKERIAEIQKALDALPPRCREIFMASRFGGKTYAAIADEMKISVKTVEAQMGKALQLLRQKIGKGYLPGT